jgi:hypothetical protein
MEPQRDPNEARAEDLEENGPRQRDQPAQSVNLPSGDIIPQRSRSSPGIRRRLSLHFGFSKRADKDSQLNALAEISEEDDIQSPTLFDNGAVVGVSHGATVHNREELERSPLARPLPLTGPRSLALRLQPHTCFLGYFWGQCTVRKPTAQELFT